MGTLEIVMSVVIIFIIIFLMTGGAQKIFGYFRTTSETVQSCSGMGFMNGVCIAENDITECLNKIQGLNCPGDRPVCCFKASEGSGSSIPVSITGIDTTPPTSRGSSFIVQCDTNVEARGCITVSVNNQDITCQTETWTSYTSSTTGGRVNQVQISCIPPSGLSGSVNVCCSVNSARCTPQSSTTAPECTSMNLP